MPRFPTPLQDVAIDLAFKVVGESRINRTYREYMDIAARLGPLKVLLYKINERLRELREVFGDQLPKICRFKAGDERIVYEPFPISISYETLRAALTVSGMRRPRQRRRK